MLALAGLALAADPGGGPVLHLVVTDPGGEVVLDQAAPLPLEHTLPWGGHALGIWAARFDGERAVIELVTGRERGGVPKPRFSRSDELDPFVPADLALAWKGEEPWRVTATLGRTWAAPEPRSAAGPCVAAGGGPVTARALTAWAEDGTGHQVAPGVPVEPLGDGTGRIRAGDLTFLVRLEEGDLGPPGDDLAGPRWPEVAAAPQALGPGSIGRTRWGEVRWEGPTPLPVAGRTDVRSHLVTVQVACARLVIRPASGAAAAAAGP